MSNWQELEEYTKGLLKNDLPKLPSGSGSSKGEEDVIGLSIIAQCKYTEDKNMSILKKDLDRLIDAAKLQDKIPVFITSSQTNKVLSVPITKDTEQLIEYLVEFISIYKGTEKLVNDRNNITTIDIHNKTSSRLSNLRLRLTCLYSQIKDHFTFLTNHLKVKYDHLTTYDLFE
jgi:hypothetical protein